jgi:hypothetical protein
VCVSLTLEGGDRATEGAGASHRACHGSMSLKREGTVPEVAKGRRGWCPRKRHVGPPSSFTIQKRPRGFSIASNTTYHFFFVFPAEDGVGTGRHASALGIACQHAMPYLYTRTQSSDTISCLRISVSTPGVPAWSFQEANAELDLHLFVSGCTGSCFTCGM